MKQNSFQKAVSGIPSPSNIIWVEKPAKCHAYQIDKNGILPDWLLYALKNGKAKRLEGGDGSLHGFYVTTVTNRKEWAGKGEVILHPVDDHKCENLKVITKEVFKDMYITNRALMIQETIEWASQEDSAGAF